MNFTTSKRKQNETKALDAIRTETEQKMNKAVHEKDQLTMKVQEAHIEIEKSKKRFNILESEKELCEKKMKTALGEKVSIDRKLKEERAKRLSAERKYTEEMQKREAAEKKLNEEISIKQADNEVNKEA